MRFRTFNLHESVPAIQMEEPEFYTNRDVIDESELLHDETLQLILTPAAASSDNEDSDYQNPPELKIPFEPEVLQSHAADTFVHTAPPTQEPPHDLVIFPPRAS